MSYTICADVKDALIRLKEASDELLGMATIDACNCRCHLLSREKG